MNVKRTSEGNPIWLEDESVFEQTFGVVGVNLSPSGEETNRWIENDCDHPMMDLCYTEGTECVVVRRENGSRTVYVRSTLNKQQIEELLRRLK